MTVFPHDIHTLFVEELHQYGVLGIEITPERQFRLQVYAQFISSSKGRLWRAPRVETHMVDAIVLTRPEILMPSHLVHRTMTRQRPYAGIMLAAQENTVALSVVEMAIADYEGGIPGPIDLSCPICPIGLIGPIGPTNSPRTLYVHQPDNAVPVGLCIFRIGMTAGIELFWHTTTIIYKDSECMQTWSQRVQLVALWG